MVVDVKKIVILGNSGAGKTTLAKKLSAEYGVPHLDLDTLAWLPSSPPERRPLEDSKQEIDRFIGVNTGWVIEGCYVDLIEFAIPSSSELIFLRPSKETCIQRAKSREWEQHKYSSKEEQDANLPMLIDWISGYEDREDVLSFSAHSKLYQIYAKTKQIIE